MEKKHYICTRFEFTIQKTTDFHASDTVQFHTILCVPVLAHHLYHTLQEVRHRQKNPDMVSVHMRGALLLPCALLHHRVAPPDGVSLNTLFTVGLSTVLRLYLLFGLPAQRTVQTLSHTSPRNHSGCSKILLTV